MPTTTTNLLARLQYAIQSNPIPFRRPPHHHNTNFQQPRRLHRHNLPPNLLQRLLRRHEVSAYHPLTTTAAAELCD